MVIYRSQGFDKINSETDHRSKKKTFQLETWTLPLSGRGGGQGAPGWGYGTLLPD